MKTCAAAPHAPAPRPELLHSLVAEHRNALTAYAERLLGDHHLAEDIAQEALIRAWPHTDRLYSTEGSIRGWLFKVTRNLVIDRLRSAAVRYETVGAETYEVSQRDHTDAVLASVESTRLLRLLSHEHREVLVHTYLCGRTVQETAGILGVPAGTVKSRQHYALSKLRSRGRAGAL
ncbi:RNA polymerase sigma-70 factor, ECF subfamily [Streptomyces sp. DvalAA-14]|uniref:sigma-70 family RNA polymerase sigma factor n=1 Tax=unclassified Streptomyces TaxID=2593676 RepID=UPI00081B8E6A|nr:MULTISPECIES: sigma-70 family RNA polymerase sigma factor [unclassified Streptomyces]MYS18982.1 sigma-70 family RNA polymerase sigma factor [Streptomyces sp. SID4948]SCD33257.1 RNA polymerase sigma-70 factor, ECF subfamily [Streptomyces sp. DvalAA-14]